MNNLTNSEHDDEPNKPAATRHAQSTLPLVRVLGRLGIVSSIVLAIVMSSLAITCAIALISGHAIKGGVEGAAGALTLFIALAVLFASIAIRKHRHDSALNELERERSILTYAKHENRPVTIPEVALNCDIRIVDAGNVLNRLTARGVCQMDVSEGGEIVYRFVRFRSAFELGMTDSQFQAPQQE